MTPTWNSDVSVDGTSLQGYLQMPWGFEETVARVLALTGQSAQEQGDGYKLSVEFRGVLDGQVFTLYDYKGDRELHIGGRTGLQVSRLNETVVGVLKAVTPQPYQATEHYDECAGLVHEFKGDRA